jgi:hypothetical protein
MLFSPNGRNQLPEEVVRRYLEAVAVRMARLGKPWREISDGEILSQVGVRKVLIAAGKSSRFSPALARKQLARGDGFSPLLLQARQAAGVHCCADVVVVDPAVACHLISRMALSERIPDSEFKKAFQKLDLPEKVAALVKNMGDFDPLVDSPARLAEVCRQARAILKACFPHDPAQVEHSFDEFTYTLLWPIVERTKVPIRSSPEVTRTIGRDALLALARPWGPGEALIEALTRLKRLGMAPVTRYVMPIYADYAPALLPDYPPIYLRAYMEAVASPEAVITLGAKSPLDKVEDRGNIVFTEGRDGLEPLAIREWRDMTPAEREEAQRRLELSRQTGEPHHGLNAGIFVIDRAWAEQQITRLHRDFNHPDPAKGKLREYWYTDLVELAARQRKPRKVVFLGQDAPAGCKDVPRICRFNEEMINAVRKILLELGMHLDLTARVRLTGFEPVFSLETVARQVFDERPDSVFIYGDVFIEDTVRIADGAVLDGRGRPVELRGDTSVGKGVGIRGSTAADTRFVDNSLDEFSYQPPKGTSLNTLTEVIGSDLLASHVGPGVAIAGSRLTDCFVEGAVAESTLFHALVAPDETVAGLNSLAPVLGAPGRLKCGAFLVGELNHRDREGVLNFVRKETQKLLLDKISDEEALNRALAATDRLWECQDFLAGQTPELLYRHAFGWLRLAAGSHREHRGHREDIPFYEEKRPCSSVFVRVHPSDPFYEEKRSEIEALWPVMETHWERLLKHDVSDAAATRALFREMTLLATQANLFDWQSPTVRELLKAGAGKMPKKVGNRSQMLGFQGLTSIALESGIPASLALDDTATYESLIFDTPPADFLYLTDNAGEALFDALVWYLLCQLGHRVTVAAKARPAGGDATVADVLDLVNERPALRRHFDRRTLRVISNGSDTYGTLLDRVPEEFRVVYHCPTLRAIIGKGQANLYTTVARNRLKVPFVAQFLVKGMTAERLSGVRGLRRHGKKVPRPAIAVIPPGCCITEVAPGRPGAGTLKRLGVMRNA